MKRPSSAQEISSSKTIPETTIVLQEHISERLMHEQPNTKIVSATNVKLNQQPTQQFHPPSHAPVFNDDLHPANQTSKNVKLSPSNNVRPKSSLDNFTRLYNTNTVSSKMKNVKLHSPTSKRVSEFQSPKTPKILKSEDHPLPLQDLIDNYSSPSQDGLLMSPGQENAEHDVYERIVVNLHKQMADIQFDYSQLQKTHSEMTLQWEEKEAFLQSRIENANKKVHEIENQLEHEKNMWETKLQEKTKQNAAVEKQLSEKWKKEEEKLNQQFLKWKENFIKEAQQHEAFWQNELAALHEESGQQKSFIDTINTELCTIKGDVEYIVQEINVITDSLEDVQKVKDELINHCQEMDKIIEERRQKEDSVLQQNEEILRKYNHSESALELQKKQIKDLEEQISDHIKQKQDLQATLSNLNRTYNIMLQEEKQNNEDLAAANINIEKELQAEKVHIHDLELEKGRLQQTNQILNAEILEVENQVHELKTQLEEQHQQHKDIVGNYTSTISSLQEQLVITNQQLSSQKQHLESEEAKWKHQLGLSRQLCDDRSNQLELEKVQFDKAQCELKKQYDETVKELHDRLLQANNIVESLQSEANLSREEHALYVAKLQEGIKQAEKQLEEQITNFEQKEIELKESHSTLIQELNSKHDIMKQLFDAQQEEFDRKLVQEVSSHEEKVKHLQRQIETLEQENISQQSFSVLKQEELKQLYEKSLFDNQEQINNLNQTILSKEKLLEQKELELKSYISSSNIEISSIKKQLDDECSVLKFRITELENNLQSVAKEKEEIRQNFIEKEKDWLHKYDVMEEAANREWKIRMEHTSKDIHKLTSHIFKLELENQANKATIESLKNKLEESTHLLKEQQIHIQELENDQLANSLLREQIERLETQNEEMQKNLSKKDEQLQKLEKQNHDNLSLLLDLHPTEASSINNNNITQNLTQLSTTYASPTSSAPASPRSTVSSISSFSFMMSPTKRGLQSPVTGRKRQMGVGVLTSVFGVNNSISNSSHHI